jgi:predicted ATP-grasp superfamily ATP-dependent carboligase
VTPKRLKQSDLVATTALGTSDNEDASQDSQMIIYENHEEKNKVLIVGETPEALAMAELQNLYKAVKGSSKAQTTRPTKPPSTNTLPIKEAGALGTTAAMLSSSSVVDDETELDRYAQ